MSEKKNKFTPRKLWDEVEPYKADYSDPYIKQYIEIKPYQKDENGNFLNTEDYPILKELEPINIQDYIDSFKDECDIYNILERVAKGETNLLNQKTPIFKCDADISNIPNNTNEQNEYFKNIEIKQAEILKEIEKLKAEKTPPTNETGEIKTNE